MLLILIEKFDQKSNSHLGLAWIRPYKSRWAQMGIKLALKSW